MATLAVAALTPVATAAASPTATLTYDYDGTQHSVVESNEDAEPKAADLRQQRAMVARGGRHDGYDDRPQLASASARLDGYGSAPRTTSWVDDATAPIGRRGSPIEIAPGTNSPATIGGRQYTGHALDRMQGRGIMPSAVDDTIATSRGVPGADGPIIHYSPANNISVVLNADGSVRTVSYGVFKPR